MEREDSPAEPAGLNAVLLGFGLDSDAHVRMTRGENYFLSGGSEATHQAMQDTVVRFHAELKKRGKPIEDVTAHEFFEIAEVVEP